MSLVRAGQHSLGGPNRSRAIVEPQMKTATQRRLTLSVRARDPTHTLGIRPVSSL